MSGRAQRALGFCLACWLTGCVFDGNLGSHEREQTEAAQTADEQASSAASAAEPVIPSEPASDEPTAAAMDLPLPPEDEPVEPPAEPTPGTPTDGVPPPHDAGVEPPAMTEPDPPLDAGVPIEHPPVGCDMATDNPCLVCDQTSCCEPRRACLELESCACNLHCEATDNPAECRGACADPGERYEPWRSCLVERCSDHCTL